MPSQTASGTDLTTQLAQIGLHATAGNLDDFIARAAKGRWSMRAALEEMTRMELHERAGRSLRRRLARARLGRFKPMADFDWNWPKKIDREAVERALTVEFIREARNLILLGTNGLGKTMITKNIAYAAVLAGHTVLCKTAAEMSEDLQV